MKEEELWLPVVGFEGKYEVSNLGRVRRPLSFKKSTSAAPGKILRPSVNNKGYAQNLLYPGGGRPRRQYPVHSLVCTAFLGPRPDGMCVNHRDGIKRNNRLSNLEYISPKANIEHAAAAGLIKSSLSREDVIEVKRLIGKIPSTEIARRFGVVKSTISAIKSGKTWKHVA